MVPPGVGHSVLTRAGRRSEAEIHRVGRVALCGIGRHLLISSQMTNRFRCVAVRARSVAVSGLVAVVAVGGAGAVSVAVTTSARSVAATTSRATTLPAPPKGVVIGPSDVAPIVANDTTLNNRANSSLSISLQDGHEACLQAAVDDATFRGERAAGATTLGGSFNQVPTRTIVARESAYPAWFSVLAEDKAARLPTTTTLLTYTKSAASSPWKLALSSEILGPTAAGVAVPAASSTGGFVTSLPLNSTDGLMVAPNNVASRIAAAFTSEAVNGKLPSGVAAQFGPKGAADPHLLVSSYSGAGSATLQALVAPPSGANLPSFPSSCVYPAIRLANGGALVSFAMYYELAVHIKSGNIVVQPSDRSSLGALLAPGAYTSVSMVLAVMGVAVVPRAGSKSPIDVIGQTSGVLAETGTLGTGSVIAGGVGGPSNAGAIAKKVNAAVVDINATLSNSHAEVAGTGIVITSNGEVVTNNHVIEGATSVKAFDVGNGKTYVAKVLGYDRSSDVAVLQLVGASKLATAQIATGSSVHVGDGVVGIGNAGGRGGTPSYAGGKVLALNQSITASNADDGTSEQLTGLLATNAQIQPGDSGGPLVNTSAKVIGMDAAASAGLSFQQGGTSASEGFSIPIGVVLGIARAVTSGKATTTVHIGPTAFLGVGVAPQRTSGGFGGFGSGSVGGTARGAQISSVVPGSPAALGHLVAGDTIVSVAGHSVASPSALSSVMSMEKPGATVRLAYIDSSGNQRSVSVQLVSGPPQ